MHALVTGGSAYIPDAHALAWLDAQLAAYGCIEPYAIGDCPTGVDACVTAYWRALGKAVRIFVADWERHGSAAGPIRNREMVRESTANGTLPGICLAFPGGEETDNALRLAYEYGMAVVRYPGREYPHAQTDAAAYPAATEPAQ
jgi:hypothetical protein